jgi:transcriptional regulator with XRE-family HTH domain
MTIGDRVRQLRLGQGLNASELARRSQLPPATVTRVEQGKSSPTSATVEKLAWGLGVEPGVLFGSASKARTPRPTTYLELLDLAGVEDSGLERPVERNAPGNISELFKGLPYVEAYQRYQRLARKRKTLRRLVENLLRQNLDSAAEHKIKSLDTLAYQRMLVAFGIVYAALEEAKANTRMPQEVGEIEELQNELTLAGAPG